MKPQNSTEHTASYFTSVAPSYDRLQPILAGPGYQAGLTMLVKMIPFTPDDAFLFIDLGCGTAELTARILARFPHAEGICVDADAAMLDEAQDKLGEEASRVTFQCADMLSVSIPPCHVVVSSKAVHHVAPDDLHRLLQKMISHLHPRGWFLLLDHMTVGTSFGPQIQGQVTHLRQQHVQTAIHRGEVTQEEVDARWAFKRQMKTEGNDVEYQHSAEQILQMMTQAGFHEVGIIWRMFADTLLAGVVTE